jgi:predicted transcriptional regulator
MPTGVIAEALDTSLRLRIMDVFWRGGVLTVAELAEAVDVPVIVAARELCGLGDVGLMIENHPRGEPSDRQRYTVNHELLLRP